MNKNLRIAVQKSGRLSEKSLALFGECGINVNTSGGKLVSAASNFPIEILFLRDDDIPQYVADGVADLGIIGENVYVETGIDLQILDRLGFSRCRLCLAVPKNTEYKDVTFFNNKKIATSYPVLLQSFLDENKIKAEIHEISGSVEIAPSIGLADAIFDIVSSGSTLLSNGLKEVETTFRSEAILIGSKNLSAEKQDIVKNLLFRIASVKKAKDNKYILLNVPNDKIETIKALIPGMRSPSILPLADSGWSSIHSVVNENDFWGLIDKLKENGAQGILVVPIEKMIL